MSCVLVVCAWGNLRCFCLARLPYLSLCRMSFPLLQAGSSVGDRGRGLEFDNCTENFDGRKVSHEPLAAAMCAERTGGFEPVASSLSQPHTVTSNILPLPFQPHEITSDILPPPSPQTPHPYPHQLATSTLEVDIGVEPIRPRELDPSRPRNPILLQRRSAYQFVPRSLLPHSDTIHPQSTVPRHMPYCHRTQSKQSTTYPKNPQHNQQRPSAGTGIVRYCLSVRGITLTLPLPLPTASHTPGGAGASQAKLAKTKDPKCYQQPTWTQQSYRSQPFKNRRFTREPAAQRRRDSRSPIPPPPSQPAYFCPHSPPAPTPLAARAHANETRRTGKPHREGRRNSRPTCGKTPAATQPTEPRNLKEEKNPPRVTRNPRGRDSAHPERFEPAYRASQTTKSALGPPEETGDSRRRKGLCSRAQPEGERERERKARAAEVAAGECGDATGKPESLKVRARRDTTAIGRRRAANTWNGRLRTTMDEIARESARKVRLGGGRRWAAGGGGRIC